MWTNPEEARSDFVLAAAVALFGPLLLILLRSLLPSVLEQGVVWAVVSIAALFAFTGLVPLLLARYRGEGMAAFGLDAPRAAIARGLLLAIPAALVGVMVLWSQPIPTVAGQAVRGQLAALLGALGFLVSGGGPIEALLSVLALATAIVGNVLLYTFLTVKARDGFGRTDITMLEALRTYGALAAAGGLVIGLLLAAIQGGVLRVTLEALALFSLVLIADRMVVPGHATTRAAVLAPAIVALLAGVELFGGHLLTSLRSGLLGAGVIIVVAVLVETRRHAWAVVPLIAAVILYPTALAGFRPM